MKETYKWPFETASNSQFLYKTYNKYRKCRLVPSIKHDIDSNKESIKIQIVSWEDPLNVFDLIDPADIIGAELQIDFLQEPNLAQSFESFFSMDVDSQDESTLKCTNWTYKEKKNDEKSKEERNLFFCGSGSGSFEMMEESRNSLSKAKARLNIYCYPQSSKTGMSKLVSMNSNSNGYRKGKHRTLEVVPCEDFANARACVREIRKLAKLGQFDFERESEMLKNPKRYLVVVNPFSGTGKGKMLYEKHISPMLNQAGVDHDVFFTQYAFHASERMMKVTHGDEDTDISEYDAIIVVGGDGILWEVLQGLWKRSDREEILSRIQFGIVGGGTCNGLAKSILHSSQEKYNVIESVFLICKGKSTYLDLSVYYTETKSYTSFLTFSYGIIAEVDLESEKLRYLGSIRNEIWTAWRVIHLRSYPVRFSYLPPSSSYAKDKMSPNMNVDLLPSLNECIPSNWVTIEDDFILFWAAQVSHASWDIHNSPDSRLQDGLFRILVIRKSCSRLKLLNVLLKLNTGDHVKDDVCEVYDCIAYRLEPLKDGSYNNLDGEEIESGPIQGCVLPRAIQFFGGSN